MQVAVKDDVEVVVSVDDDVVVVGHVSHSTLQSLRRMWPKIELKHWFCVNEVHASLSSCPAQFGDVVVIVDTLVDVLVDVTVDEDTDDEVEVDDVSSHALHKIGQFARTRPAESSLLQSATSTVLHVSGSASPLHNAMAVVEDVLVVVAVDSVDNVMEDTLVEVLVDFDDDVVVDVSVDVVVVHVPHKIWQSARYATPTIKSRHCDGGCPTHPRGSATLLHVGTVVTVVVVAVVRVDTVVVKVVTVVTVVKVLVDVVRTHVSQKIGHRIDIILPPMLVAAQAARSLPRQSSGSTSPLHVGSVVVVVVVVVVVDVVVVVVVVVAVVVVAVVVVVVDVVVVVGQVLHNTGHCTSTMSTSCCGVRSGSHWTDVRRAHGSTGSGLPSQLASVVVVMVVAAVVVVVVDVWGQESHSTGHSFWSCLCAGPGRVEGKRWQRARATTHRKMEAKRAK